MSLPTLQEIEAAAAIIRPWCPPTPQYAWPLLAARAGCEVWVKHENQTPIGAFKLRGGLYYLHRLRASGRRCKGLISATRGNHGQSLALAGRAFGVPVHIVVPHGNSVEKNAAMRALGANLLEIGEDYEDARLAAEALAQERGLEMVGSFSPTLVCGVATYALEFFRHCPPLERVYVGIGLGSGASGLIAARDALGLNTEIVGVVAEGAPCYALSLAAGAPVATAQALTIADGLACRSPSPAALAILESGLARIVQVSEAQIKAAMRAYYTDTHNLAEGAGAAALAALLLDSSTRPGGRVGVVLSGGNVDAAVFAEVLRET
jgi:threonine dehydratase